MGRHFTSLVNSIGRTAKHGKAEGIFAIYAEEKKLLEDEGFKVEVRRPDHVKNMCEARISWRHPAFTGGLAEKEEKLVEDYCNKCNSKKAACQIKVAKKSKADRRKATSISEARVCKEMDRLAVAINKTTSEEVEEYDYDEEFFNENYSG